ncbi:MAG: sugar phosphate isomerase/epimerase [Dehalococcoidales bacterium]|nr:MAG: sugar phosphate isomerase/epimerase [Dehalococcoidales bacterium]
MNRKVLERLSYHVVYDESIVEAIEFASGNGFSGIQVAVESPHLSFENLSLADRAEIRRRGEELGIRVVIHGPDDVASLLEPSSQIRKGILVYYADLFTFAGDIGAILTTIHIGHPAVYPTDTVPEMRFSEADIRYYRKALETNLQSIIELARGRGYICIENYLLEDFVLQVLARYLTESKLGLCWDITKTHNRDGSINESLQHYMKENLSAVRQVHLHDLDSKGRSHRVVGTGIIDFGYYLELLRDIDVLDYCIEVRPREKAVESLENLKMMSWGDTNVP